MDLTKKLPAKTNRAKIEEKILKFWQQNKIFNKSISTKPASKTYTFYDGPPFVTGTPHYGSLLSSIAKDLIPRFFTMKGYRIRRVWGWDCHGLPIENKVEQQYGLKNRQDIQKIGLTKFIEGCFKYVSSSSPEWKWYVDRVGRWVDFDNAYKTMDLDYMETVIWVFKQIYDKDLIYQGKRVSLYCPRCVTPVSNFEIAMDNSYIQVTEPANVYKYKLVDQPNTYILAWSTTPWNKLATPALAVNPKFTYVKVKQDNEYYILAKSTLKILKDKYKVVDQFKGSKLEGVKFEPHFDFYQPKQDDYAFVITCADFVTADDGTGVVTIAAYGEDDFNLMKAKHIPMIEHINEEGFIKSMVKGYEGIYYLQANAKVNAELTKRNLMYREDMYQHSVPVCWRCKTRLLHAPQDAWFINVQKLKDKLLATNQKINWVPKHIKNGRFALGIKEAPDWCISRNRYWATPMPVWQCQQCKARKIVGSIKEIEKLSGKKVTDLHRPYIDKFYFKCEQCGGKMKRIPEVLDCWLESGSMPYGERHYPFANKSEFRASFPADYISEYVAQTRAWFYVMHVVSNALFGSHCFKNCVVTGVIMGSDGRKMSKSYGNYPDPKKTISSYGGDALRLYLMSSSLLLGENVNVAEDEIRDQLKTVLIPLYNCLRYLVTYASWHKFKPRAKFIPKHSLDKWILTRVQELINNIDHNLSSYYVPPAVRLIHPFIDDLSSWFIRLSRSRFAKGDADAMQTLYLVLRLFSQSVAPIIPFVSEEIWQVIKNKHDKLSIHLCDYPPRAELSLNQKQELKDMAKIREIVSLGHNQRKLVQIPVRQPLAAAVCSSPGKKPKSELVQLIAHELNVGQVVWKNSKQKLTVKLDTQLTKALKDEGQARQIVRQIGAKRKQMGLSFSDRVEVVLPDWPQSYTPYIKQSALVDKLVKGSSFVVKKK